MSRRRHRHRQRHLLRLMRHIMAGHCRVTAGHCRGDISRPFHCRGCGDFTSLFKHQGCFMLTVRGQLRGQAHQHYIQPAGSQMHSLTGCNWQCSNRQRCLAYPARWPASAWVKMIIENHWASHWAHHWSRLHPAPQRPAWLLPVQMILTAYLS